MSASTSVPDPLEKERWMLTSTVRIVLNAPVSMSAVTDTPVFDIGPAAKLRLVDRWSTVQSSSPLVFSPTRMMTMENMMPLIGVAYVESNYDVPIFFTFFRQWGTTYHLGHKFQRLASAQQRDVIDEQVGGINSARLDENLHDRHQRGGRRSHEGAGPAVDLPDSKSEQRCKRISRRMISRSEQAPIAKNSNRLTCSDGVGAEAQREDRSDPAFLLLDRRGRMVRKDPHYVCTGYCECTTLLSDFAPAASDMRLTGTSKRQEDWKNHNPYASAPHDPTSVALFRRRLALNPFFCRTEPDHLRRRSLR